MFKIRPLLVLLALVVLVVGCTRETETENAAPAKPFFLRGLNGLYLPSIPADVVAPIHDHLISKGRTDDAMRFLKTYDKNGNVMVALPEVRIQGDANGRTKYPVDVEIYGHVESIGWKNYGFALNVSEYYKSPVVGTTGLGKRLEAFSINMHWAGDVGCCIGAIEYRAHVQGIGWQAWKDRSEIAGTTGERRRIEAIQLHSDNGFIRYRAHVQSLGWMAWVNDSAVAGTTGQSRRLEAFEFEIYLFE